MVSERGERCTACGRPTYAGEDFGGPCVYDLDTECALASFQGTYEPRYIPPRNTHGYPMWCVEGWSCHEWTRTTTIGDELESGPSRVNGPTARDAARLALVLSAIPLLLRERAELRAELTALEAIAEERRERAKRAELELAELRQHASEKP